CNAARFHDPDAGNTSSCRVRSSCCRDGTGNPGGAGRADSVPPVTAVATPTGLTSAEVAERVRAGKVNVAEERTSRSFGEILRANVFTRFNALLGTMFELILIFGEHQDALFGFVLLFNTLIGVVQEYRAKRTLDRL